MSDVIQGAEADQLITSILAIAHESKAIEFKRIAGKKVVSKLLETVVAMANADGGHIFVGVDDPEAGDPASRDRVVGIEEDEENFDMFVQGLADITPRLIDEQAVDLVRYPQSGRTVAIVKIPKAARSFHQLGKRVFIRQNRGNRELSPDEYADMLYAKGFKKADGELVKGVAFDLLETQWFERWRKERNLEGPTEEILTKAGLAAENDSGQLLPKRAAVLLFAELPDSLMADGRCAVRIFRYKDAFGDYGDRPNLVSTPINLEGPTIQLIRDAQRRMLDILASGVRVESGFVNEYIIPERAIKEAITNAVIHRDYSIKKDIEIRIYEDRVEVVSPGMLVYNITLQNIGIERAEGYRNDLLVKHLREFPDPPNLDANEGVNTIRKEMKAQNLYPPAYSTWPTKDELGLKYYVKVRLLNESAPDEWSKVEAYLKQNNYINNSKAREVTGVVQIVAMSKMLQKWLVQDLIEKVANGGGTRRYARYKLKTKKEFGGKP